MRTSARALALAAILLGTATGTPALGFNIDTARTMMAFSDAIHDQPNTAIDRMRAMGATETKFLDGGAFAANQPGLFDPGSQVSCSKMTRNGKTIFVVAFRGTEVGNAQDLNTDLNFKYTALSPQLGNVKVHTGFLKTSNLGIEALRPYLDQIKNDPNCEVVFTGHSLGGAAASIASAQLVEAGVPKDRVSAYTFGAPAVGNSAFEKRYRDLNVWRIDRPNDPVPKLLDNGLMGFHHIGKHGVLENGSVNFEPPRRQGLLGRLFSGIKTLLGVFGIGKRAKELDLTQHTKDGYIAGLGGANATGLNAAQLASSIPIVTQPAQSVAAITGSLPTT